MWLRLAASRAPGRANGAPALPAQRADDSLRVAVPEQRMAQQALSGKKELLDCRAKHAARD